MKNMLILFVTFVLFHLYPFVTRKRRSLYFGRIHTRFWVITIPIY